MGAGSAEAGSADDGALRVIIAGGGTGGHLFPGLAVAERLRARAGARVFFVGSARGIEARVVPQTGFPLRTLPVRALRGQRFPELLAAAAALPKSLVAAWRFLSEIRPRIVVGVGGYASAPTVVAAWLRRRPTVLLEQNAVPGLTNRLLGRVADRICVSFPESAGYFPAARTVVTGNPVRLPAAAAPKRDGTFSLLVFGGSAGAHRLNEVVVEAAARLRAAGKLPRITHQTGAHDAERVTHRYREAGIDADVRIFIEDMPAAYAAADLIVCRAGATTLAELTALGKPAVLVPYPYAADDHQRKNAEALVARGAALMILDRDLDAGRLVAEIARLEGDRAALAAMAHAAAALGRPAAAEHVVDVCLELAGDGGR